MSYIYKRTINRDLRMSKTRKVRTPPKTDFHNYYIPSRNWLEDELKDQYHEHMRSIYSEFYKPDGTPDLEKLKQNLNLFRITLRTTDKSIVKTKDFFSYLFRMPFKLDPEKKGLIQNYIYLERIKREHGATIMAHGVDELKGGMYNLLMMCVCDCVKTNAYQWGRLVDGIGNFFPVNHGPYFIIYDDPQKLRETPDGSAPISSFAFILVPFQENVAMMRDKLNELRQVGLITEAQEKLFSSKLISYENYYNILQAKNNLTSSADTNKLFKRRLNIENIVEEKPANKRVPRSTKKPS